jgi:hypothetical protein
MSGSGSRPKQDGSNDCKDSHNKDSPHKRASDEHCRARALAKTLEVICECYSQHQKIPISR